ncbi:iron-sulfur cluster assembly 2 homolog, mitochondrial-like [Mytilus californianus]|uniref:iron-sulfur cluster assembly 2 homolog, mitochondrial-like n=1 Tax=Mytilus californianus TaxID=6549 RepID=UPI002247022E|nr:iron-sulfur cluster assembly 2 homolog, mitochondrial-like [Mytilus californianus]
MTSLLKKVSYSALCTIRRQNLTKYKNLSGIRYASTKNETEQVESEQSSEALRLSQSAINRLKRISYDDGTFLRVVVEGGGCSGFQTKFEFDTKVDKDDIVIEKDGVRVAIDNDSLEFVRGSTVDFHEELIRSAFAIVNNPQAEQGCSCGASFSLKL